MPRPHCNELKGSIKNHPKQYLRFVIVFSFSRFGQWALIYGILGRFRMVICDDYGTPSPIGFMALGIRLFTGLIKPDHPKVGYWGGLLVALLDQSRVRLIWVCLRIYCVCVYHHLQQFSWTHIEHDDCFTIKHGIFGVPFFF